MLTCLFWNLEVQVEISFWSCYGLIWSWYGKTKNSCRWQMGRYLGQLHQRVFSLYNGIIWRFTKEVDNCLTRKGRTNPKPSVGLTSVWEVGHLGSSHTPCTEQPGESSPVSMGLGKAVPASPTSSLSMRGSPGLRMSKKLWILFMWTLGKLLTLSHAVFSWRNCLLMACTGSTLFQETIWVAEPRKVVEFNPVGSQSQWCSPGLSVGASLV